jgi:phytoene dehydrogenase-like protein
MDYDVIVVGGGVAGLTAAAYLCGSGLKTLVCEKEDTLGGLVNSFDYNGFTFDGGIRAIENSGIVFPMLRQLGLDIDFVKNNVSIGIEGDIVHLVSDDSLQDYQAMLQRLFPDNARDIDLIIADVRRIMTYMNVLYGIDNPLFLDLKKDREYLRKTILPWMFKYLTTIGKIQKLNMPVEEYLCRFTDNQTLIDMIAQHFFRKTPAFFAMSYFHLYLDYQYPTGGTGMLVKSLADYIRSHGGELCTGTRICGVDPEQRQLTDGQGVRFGYKKLIWAADIKQFYRLLNIRAIKDRKVQQRVRKQKTAVADKVGGDSVLTLYLTADRDKQSFEAVCGAHFFFTPYKKGLSHASLGLIGNAEGDGFTDDKTAITDWLRQFLKLTTFEISFPVMRDERLAPPGKTGLIISTLIDYAIVSHISRMGWYDEFKELCAACIIDVLSDTAFPGLKDSVTDRFVSTPLTIEKRTGNAEGAITGWAFTNKPVPAVSRMTQIAKAVLTPVPHVLQAGQWSFSPSGLPISILTGKLAADAAVKQLKR